MEMHTRDEVKNDFSQEVQHTFFAGRKLPHSLIVEMQSNQPKERRMRHQSFTWPVPFDHENYRSIIMHCHFTC